MNQTIIILTAIAALVAGVLLSRYFSRLVRRTSMTRRFRRGAEGEREAVEYLCRNGYRIMETQACRQMTMSVDGKPFTYDIRADFIAEKQGKKCLVEVKTGSRAVDPAYTDTRRQLLEYAVSFDVDKVCLFDADAGTLREIGLPMVRIQYRDRARTFFAGLAAGIVLAAIVAVCIAG